jgi:hypothetical protein
MFCNIAKPVLDRMTKNEVAKMVAGLRDEASNLEDWNTRRAEPRPTPGFNEVLPPKSMAEYEWRDKTR